MLLDIFLFWASLQVSNIFFYLLLLLSHCVSDFFVTPWTLARQATVGFPRKEYWSGLPFPSPGHIPNPEIEPLSVALQADFLPLSQGEATFLFKHY